MKIPKLHSIAELTIDDCIQTKGSAPLRVFCDDFEYYIMKYFRGQGAAFTLFNEYIASRLLQIWNIETPEIAFIRFKKEHIGAAKLPFRYFDYSCFGSRYYSGKDVDQFFGQMNFSSTEYDAARKSYLMIALFDIWISNEDRTQDNFNLLYNTEKRIFIPIDHVQIFNGNNLDKQPAIITPEESILNSKLLQSLFYRTLQPKYKQTLRIECIQNFKLYCKSSHEKLSQVLLGLPPDWQLDNKYLAGQMSYLFTDEWMKACIKTFNHYLQISLNHK